MKKILLIFISLLFIISCTLTPQPYSIKDYKTGEIKKATVGSPMIRWEQGETVDDIGSIDYVWKGYMMELVYLGKNKDNIKIKYNEYKRDSQCDLYIRDKFSNTMTYDLSKNNTIIYKDIEIKIINADSNVVSFEVLNDNINIVEPKVLKDKLKLN